MCSSDLKIKEKRGGEDLEAIYSTTTTAILDEPVAAPVVEAAEETTKTE